MKSRFQKNNIVDLLSDVVLVDDVLGITELDFKHFHDRFHESPLRRSSLEGVSFNSLSPEIRLREKALGLKVFLWIS